MPFVKPTKTRAYFKRFQTKFRRRRESKTDYYARKRMVTQDLNKYGTPKYRLVARTTNKKIIAQLIYSMVKGDFCIAQATSAELGQWGLKTGTSSYAAAYATGLLLARRLLNKLGMADMFKGVGEVDGKDYDVSADPNCVKLSRKPFKAILDIGNIRPTIGNRVFGVLKGACDGGVHVPHSVKRYPGYHWDADNKKGEYNAEAHQDRIFGCHIDEFMEKLKAENSDSYNKQFALWDKQLKDTKCETVEALYTKVHASIRANPNYKKVVHAKKAVNWTNKERTIAKTTKGTYMRERRFTLAQRKANVAMKIKIAKENA